MSVHFHLSESFDLPGFLDCATVYSDRVTGSRPIGATQMPSFEDGFLCPENYGLD